MNVFNWTGPEFLVFYAVLMAVTIISAAMMRRRARSPRDKPPREHTMLDCYEVAYLAGGKDKAVDAAVASLVHGKALWIRGKEVGQGAKLPKDAHPLEKAVAAIVSSSGSTLRLSTLRRKTVLPNQVTERLIELGLIVTERNLPNVRLKPLLMMFALIVVGVVKIWIGIGRGKSVGFLVLMVLAAIAVAFAFRSRPHRTIRGGLSLTTWRFDNTALRQTAACHSPGVYGHDLALAMALFGTSMLPPSMRSIYPAATRSTSSTAGASSSDSCGADSCGGGSSWFASSCSSSSSSSCSSGSSSSSSTCSSSSSSCSSSSSSCGGGGSSGCGGCGGGSS